MNDGAVSPASRQARRIAQGRPKQVQLTKSPIISTGWLYIGYGIVFIYFLNRSLPEYSGTHRVLGFLVFLVGTLPLVYHIIRQRRGVPLLEIPLATYPILFSLPLFYQAESAVYVGVLTPSEDDITKTLTCVIIAILCLLIGYRLAAGISIGRIAPRIKIGATGLIGFSLFLMVSNSLLYAGGARIPESISRVVGVVLSKDLGIAILGILYFQGKLTREWKAVVWGFLVMFSFYGLASGMTQAALQPLFMFALTKWVSTGKTPLIPGAVILVAIFLLQPVKIEYRDRVWFGGQRSLSTWERAKLYSEIVSEYWFKGGNEKKAVESVSESANQRFSLLLSTQRYIQLTPNQIPYKSGESIGYLFYGWIPRVIWESKPTAFVANRQYPVEYGLQHPNTLSTTSIGVGHVAEGYVNFGMFGMIPLFVFLGGLSRFPKKIFSESPNSVVSLSIQCFAALQLMFVGSTIGGVYGGLITAIIAQTFFLWLVSTFFSEKAS